MLVIVANRTVDSATECVKRADSDTIIRRVLPVGFRKVLKTIVLLYLGSMSFNTTCTHAI